ncbi:MAG TPA: site-specific integrase, partial [Methylomirabilota bacterium]|nr:site-specific integrase [Methylomirabilota bacterium]
KYYADGRPIRESTGAKDKKQAVRFLKGREGRIVLGQPVLPRADRVRYEEIADDLKRYYETTGKREWREAKARFDHLRQFFIGWRVVAIGPAEIAKYTEKRRGECAANGTINRELAILGRMLRLAYENGKLVRMPMLRKLAEAPPRQGFFERGQFEAVRRRLAPDIQVAVTIAHTFGWRVQSEVLSLERRQLDLEAGTLRLEPGTTKNDEARTVYLTPELKTMLAAQLERVDQLSRRIKRIVPYVFPHFGGRRRRGERRGDFRKAWETACKNAGVPGKLRHDFRRTAVRNMVNAGVPERVAMKVTGHKTRSVFDRYHIVSPTDLQDVARRLAAAGTFSGTSAPERLASRSLTPQNTSTRL